MNCPYCRKEHVRVVDSRASGEGTAIRRRRKCVDCGRRFTTYERIESALRVVVKKDGRREPFQSSKMLAGLQKACAKRNISTQALDDLASRVEAKLFEDHDREVESREIGEHIVEELKRLDQVAYVRFASVYRDFADVTEFVKALAPLLEGRDGKDTGGS